MAEENKSQELRFKKIDETRNYFLEEIQQNELMSRKHKKVCTILNHIEHFFILASAVIGCISMLNFASLLGIPIGFTSSEIGLKICVIAARIKTYKSIIKKMKRKHDKIVSLAKCKLNSLEVLISQALFDSNISHDDFVLTHNVLKEYDNMKEEIKTLNPLTVYCRFYSIFKTMLWYCLKCTKNTKSENAKFVKRKNEKLIISSKFTVLDSKISKFIKEQNASG